MIRILVILVLFPGLLVCQEKLLPQEFLTEQMSKYENLRYLPDQYKKIHFPWIEKLEFRTETHEFLAEEQEYMFRVSPSTLSERKAQKKVYDAINSRPDFESQDFFCDLSYDLQKDWIYLWFNQQLQQLMKDRLASLRQTDSMYGAGLLKLDLTKILELRNKINDLELEIAFQDLESEKLRSFYGIENRITDFSQLIGIESIISSLSFYSDATTLRDMDEIDHELMINELELKLEKAENSQFLDFMQLRYQGPETDPVSERVSIGIGFIIPNSGNRKLNIKELEIEADQLKQERDILKTELQRNLQKSLIKIQVASEQHALMKQKLLVQTQQLEELEDQTIQNDLFDPQLVIDIEKRINEIKTDLLESEYDLYRQILAFSKEFELICQDPGTHLLFPNH